MTARESAIAEIDAMQGEATAFLRSLREATVLAMRAGRYGLSSLTDKEQATLFCFPGFDTDDYFKLGWPSTYPEETA